jgi:ubiquinone/menaquinone biosynthesis C-methylase UbiE
MLRRFWFAFLRLAFHLFYNPFAFTYDWVSAIVSRGHWRAWTRTAIPYIVGTRVLEIPSGTGNLLLDLRGAGYAPIGVDLSATMLNLTRDKFRRVRANAPILRARVQALPFPTLAFDSIVMTFPPGFVHDPHAFAELHRVLADGGRLIWVDGARLLPRDGLSHALNAALDAVGGSKLPLDIFAREALARAGFESRIETVQDDASVVSVLLATRRQVE